MSVTRLKAWPKTGKDGKTPGGKPLAKTRPDKPRTAETTDKGSRPRP